MICHNLGHSSLYRDVHGLSYVLQQPAAAPDCWTGPNKGRYLKQELSFLLVLLQETQVQHNEELGRAGEFPPIT